MEKGFGVHTLRFWLSVIEKGEGNGLLFELLLAKVVRVWSRAAVEKHTCNSVALGFCSKREPGDPGRPRVGRPRESSGRANTSCHVWGAGSSMFGALNCMTPGETNPGSVMFGLPPTAVIQPVTQV
ncbi:hypothetical protein L6452_35091 [Arctium lappa]|uniref:Uncharacterized protein n=1 Tax=Arctium lappa TaxID=4217 RepID=A0ACB8YKQ2_ARCLA|nr:hypothetical protein L6452_35091 [Arctium lappa]